MADIDDKERAALAEFRSQISDLMLTEAQESDYFLIRWLRAREYEANKAKALLATYLEYRKKEDLDNVLSWEPPAALKPLAPYHILGYDGENSPVILVPGGNWNFREIVSRDLSSDFDRYIDKLFEEVNSLMVGKNTSEGVPVTQFVLILDTDKLSMLQFSSLQVVDTILQIARKLEAYHPERAKVFYIPNAGRAFSAIFSLAKPILGPRTGSKFKIFGNNPEKYKSEMLKGIPAKILPPKYGGTNMDAGDVASVDSEEDEDEQIFMQVSVPAGEKLVLNVGVEECNSTISWAFKTDKYDISFGVIRDGKAYIENKKVNSHVDLQEGTINCDQPGDYIFTFDNTYSRLRSKALSYRIDVKSPSGLKQISFG